MMADTPEELYAMAEAIGLKKGWVQEHMFLHFDLRRSKRDLAIQNGAKELSTLDMVKRYRDASLTPRQYEQIHSGTFKSSTEGTRGDE